MSAPGEPTPPDQEECTPPDQEERIPPDPEARTPSDQDQRTRVLLAIKGLGHGGAERLLADTVAFGDRDSFRYEVAYILRDQDALAASIGAGGTSVHALGGTGNGDLRWMAAFRRLLVEGNFDVVHFHLPYTAALGRLVVATLPRARRPVTMYTEHSLWNKVAASVRLLNRATIGLDRALLAVSQAAFDALPTALRARARVVVHGIDLSRSRALAKRRPAVRHEVQSELDLEPGELLVVTVANLRTEKGYDVLLDTARLLADRGLPIRIVAAGYGEQQEELEVRHRQLALQGRFRFLGHRGDALRLMVAADVFVLASHHEGLPVALMEATSVGAPIVATAVGGVPQVVVDGVSGLLVPPGNPAALADALVRMHKDPDWRQGLGRRAMEDSVRFDIGRAVAEIEATYRRVLDPGR